MMFRHRNLRGDDRGNVAVIAIVSIVAFGLVAAGIGSAISSSMMSGAAAKLNNALAQAVSDHSAKVAATGYKAVLALPAEDVVELDVAGQSVEAVQRITQPTASAVSVTVTAGKFMDGQFTDSTNCAGGASCVSATNTAAPTLADVGPTVKLGTQSGTFRESTLPPFDSIELSNSSVVAKGRDGKTYGWGYNIYSALNPSTNLQVVNPAEMTGLDGYVHVMKGGNTTAGIDPDGDLWVWGMNNYGQFGNGTTATGTVQRTPQKVTVPGVKFKKIAAMDEYSMVVMDTTGRLWGAGNNKGLLGSLPSTSPYTTTLTVLFSGQQFVDAKNGGYAQHAYAWDAAGDIYGWGDNTAGQVGIGTRNPGSNPNVTTPTKLTFPAGVKIVDVAAQDSNVIGAFRGTFFLDDDGQLWAAGTDSTAATWGCPLGLNCGSSYSPKKVADGIDVAQIVVGNTTSYARDTDGRVWAVGDWREGRYGDGRTNAQAPNGAGKTWTKAIDGAGLIAISTHPVATGVVGLDEDGALWAWGTNGNYQLGTGVPGGQMLTAAKVLNESWSIISDTLWNAASAMAPNQHLQIGAKGETDVAGFGVYCTSTKTWLTFEEPTGVTTDGYAYANLSNVGLPTCSGSFFAVKTEGTGTTSLSVYYVALAG